MDRNPPHLPKRASVLALTVLGILAGAGVTYFPRPTPQPSLNQTMVWLKGTFSTYAKYESTVTTTESSGAEEVAGHVTHSEISEWRGDLVVLQTFEYAYYIRGSRFGQKVGEVSLKHSLVLRDLDPDAVQVRRFRNESMEHRWKGGSIDEADRPVFEVVLRTRGGAKRIKSEILFDGSVHPPNSVHEISVMLYDEQIAKRIAEALAHAIRLSGGKPDPF